MLLKSSLDQGAFGLSTNFGLSDIGFFPMKKWPIFSKLLQPYGAVAKHHLEDEGQNILPAVSRLIGAARSSKTRMHISHFKSLGRSSWNYFSKALEMVETARKEGVKITYDFFPYTKTGSSLFAALPPWFRKYSPEEANLILSSAGDKRRQELKDYLKKMTLHYDKIIIASAASGFGITGKTIRQIADESGRDGEEVILNLLEANDLRVSIFNEVISEFNLELIAKDRFSAVSSDGVGYDFSAEKNQRFAPSEIVRSLSPRHQPISQKERNYVFGDNYFQNDRPSRPYSRDKRQGNDRKREKSRFGRV